MCLSRAASPLHHPLLSWYLSAYVDMPNQKLSSLTPLDRFWGRERSSQLTGVEVHSGCLHGSRSFHTRLPPHPLPACAAGTVLVIPGGLVVSDVLTPSTIFAGQDGGILDSWVLCLEAVKDATFLLDRVK